MINKLLILLFIFSNYILFSQEGWYELMSPTKNDIREIHFYDENLGVICDFEKVFLTQDGCETFKTLDTKSENSKLYSAIILDKNTIVVSGAQINNKSYLNFIKKTTNLGMTWEIIFQESFNEILFFSNLRLYKNKIAFSSSKNEINNDIYINHENTIEINDSFECIGNYWGSIDFTSDNQTGAPKDFYFHYYKNETFISSFKYTSGLEYSGFLFFDNFWFVNDKKGAFKSWDYGNNWYKFSNLSLNCNFRPEVIFKQDTGYFFTTNYQIYKSNDCINLLTCKVPPIDYFLINKIFSVNNNVAYAVGNNGLILKTTDGGGVFTDVKEDIKEAQEIKISGSKNSSYSLELKYPTSQAKLELINIMGVPLFSQSTSSQLFSISLEPYPTGIYLLKYTDKHNTQVFKLLRE